MKNKHFFTLLFLLLSSLIACSQANINVTSIERNKIVGVAFPLVIAKTLLNNEILFPPVAKGKICIVCVAFNDKGKPSTDTWVKEIPIKFEDSTVVFYEMGMIKNAPKLIRGAIEKGMRKGTDVRLHNTVANYYGAIIDYKKQLLMDNEDSCYTFLLDKNGFVQFSVEGKATTENLNQINDKITSLLK